MGDRQAFQRTTLPSMDLDIEWRMPRIRDGVTLLLPFSVAPPWPPGCCEGPRRRICSPYCVAAAGGQGRRDRILRMAWSDPIKAALIPANASSAVTATSWARNIMPRQEFRYMSG